MKKSNYWQQFLSTGKIEDYLVYHQIESDNQQKKSTGSTGVDSYAGVCERDRNDFKDGAYRGL